MSSIPFVKYTSFGNNFVIVDEIENRVFTEVQKKRFAYYATSRYFGIGADNFLILQQCDGKTLDRINDTNKYWRKMPDTDEAQFIFRMFEPDGSEALSCGNGLMCAARHLFRNYGISSARIMTEIPSQNPKNVIVGIEDSTQNCYANMGLPRRMPGNLAASSIRNQIEECIDYLDTLEIERFRQSDVIRFLGENRKLSVRGYMVFTGEPHLVVFADGGMSLEKPANYLFPQSSERKSTGGSAEKRVETGLDLVKFIGNYIARNYCHYFPRGININFVNAPCDDNSLEYRCFERGINHETLACGTGALACAYVAHKLGIPSSKKIVLKPYLCRLYDDSAEIVVRKMSDGWRISGKPEFLFSGSFFAFDSTITASSQNVQCKNEYPDQQSNSLFLN